MNDGEHVQPSFSKLMCIETSWGFSENADSDIVGLGWGPRFCISYKPQGLVLARL